LGNKIYFASKEIKDIAKLDLTHCIMCCIWFTGKKLLSISILCNLTVSKMKHFTFSPFS